MQENGVPKLAEFARKFDAAKTADKLAVVLREYHAWQLEERRISEKLYPPEPPNAQCRFALIRGLIVSNVAGFQPGELTPYFSLGSESIGVWTHSEHELSALVAEFKLGGPSLKVPKTAVACIELAVALSSVFIKMVPFSYVWIYRFDPKKPLEEQEYYEGLDSLEATMTVATIRQGLAEDLPLPRRSS